MASQMHEPKEKFRQSRRRLLLTALSLSLASASPSFAQTGVHSIAPSIADLEASVVLQLSTGHQDAAEDLVQNANAGLKDYQRYSFMKACLIRSRFMITEADPEFEKVILASPYNADGYASFLVRELDREINVDTNWGELKKLSKQNQDSLWLAWLVGIEARNLGKNQEGLVAYADLFKKVKIGSSLMHQTFANLLDETGDHETALAHRRIAVQLERKSWSLDGLANTLAALGRSDEAIEAYESAIQLDERNTSIMGNLAALFLRSGRFVEAEKLMKDASELDPASERIWYYYGMSQEAQGKKIEALDKYRHAAQIKPDYADVAKRIAVLSGHP